MLLQRHLRLLQASAFTKVPFASRLSMASQALVVDSFGIQVGDDASNVYMMDAL